MADFGPELWKPAPGFLTAYEVSSHGRIRSLLTGIIRKPVLDKDGYPRVNLRRDGKYHIRPVHRLVCEAFHGPPTLLHREVHHEDKNRANARADNLRWVSHGENMHFRDARGATAGERNGGVKITERAAQDILASRDRPALELAAKHGITNHTIYDIWNGRTWRHLSEGAMR